MITTYHPEILTDSEWSKLRYRRWSKFGCFFDFFNNAMFRMVALAEIGLKILFEKQMKMAAPDNYHWLSGWYEKTFPGKLTNINNARTRVNHFKHKPRKERQRNKFEKMGEAIKALGELLTLLENIERLTPHAMGHAIARQ